MVTKFKKLHEKIAPVWNRLLSWKKQRAQSHVEQIRPKKAMNLAPEKQAELEKLCNQLFKRKDLITSGKLQFIGLAKIKKRMGKQWSGLSKIVYNTTEEVIDKHMGKGDIFIRYQDDTYLIIFAHASLEEGQEKAALIAEEIRRRLFELDENELRNIEIREAICEIRTDFLLDQPFPDFLDALAIDMVDFEETEEPPQDAPTEDTEENFGLSDLKGVDIGASDYKPKTIPLPKKGSLPQNLAFSYTPLWDVRRNALTTYLCLARETRDKRTVFEAHRALYAGQPSENRIAIDQKILDAVMVELSSMEKDGRKLLIACPVQYETLHHFESYELYKESLMRIPVTQRQFLVFYIMNMEGGMPPKNAYWFAAPLRQFCRHVFAEIPLRRDINFNYLRNTGVDVAGVRLDGTKRSEQETINLMTAFCSKAKILKMPMTFVLGVPTLSLTTSAVCATFDFLGGPAVHEEVARPDTIHRYRYEDLLSGLINQETP